MRLSRSGLLSLAVVYLVWGSTFLAIRLAVTGEGFSPYALAAIRTLFAGLCLLGYASVTGFSLKVGRRDLIWLVFTGFLLWVGGHTLLIWASKRVDSALAALLFASVPLWSYLLTSRRRPWRAQEFFPVLLGFVGVAFVFPVSAGEVGAAGLLDGAVILFSAFLWSLGSILGIHEKMPVAVASGYQLLFAGVVNALIAALSGEPWGQPDARAWAACLYLALPGCVLAFLAYAHALRVLPLPLVMSFAYVNPLVAVVLGMVVLGENITMRSAAGIAVVLGSVFWLLRAQDRRNA
jgi:drug/metabolite transporter (DMT)-like permease